MKKNILIVGLALSMLLNVGLAAGWLNRELIGCAETPSARLGVLVRDVKVGRFDGSEAIFTLPKGLEVREASASGMDWFEPHRFRIVVTSDDSGLVDYSVDEDAAELTEYYSADIHMRVLEEGVGNER